MSRPPTKTNKQRTQFSPTTLQKLEEAFGYGSPNTEACFYADISESLFYEVCKNTPELSERFKALRNWPKIKARRAVMQAIESGDTKMAKWYLERKTDEFNPRHTSPPVTQQLDFSAEADARAEKFL